MRLGLHLSVAGGLAKTAARAEALGCECLQLFGRNARGWRGRTYNPGEVERFRALARAADITPVVVHSSYLVNLASPDRALHRQSVGSVADDLARASTLEAAFVVVHFGHHMGAGSASGARAVASAVRSILRGAPKGVMLLLENSAGRATEMGAEWSDFARVLDGLDRTAPVGVCFDTCHAHAAGHRLDGPRRVGRALRAFDSAVGLSRLRLVHLNDSRAPAGSHVDLHQHIGRGTIGDVGLRSLLRRPELRRVPAILETPIQRRGDDRRNLRRAKRLRDAAAQPPKR